MTSDERQRGFLLKAGDMYTQHVLENAPTCEKCDELMTDHKCVSEPEGGSYNTTTEHWGCRCGERVQGTTGQWPQGDGE